LQGFLVTVECADDVEVTASHDLLDVIQRQAQLPIKQDLLKPQHRLLPVVAIAVIAHTGRLEKPDFIIMMEGARCDACQFRELLNSVHGTILNPNVTLKSRVFKSRLVTESCHGYNAGMQYWLSTSPWYGVILWIILYISDYYLTLYSARGFREIGHFQFEGSFELTPQFQKDIDALNLISRRHLIALILSSLLLLLIWWLTRFNFYLELAYLLFLGMFLLMEVAIHLRHFRNISLIRTVRKYGGIEGQVGYKKWFSYRVSANEFYTFAALFLIIAILTYSQFFLGGAITSLAVGIRHSRLARITKLIAIQTIETKT
jgi:hypothetical protein